MNEEFPQQYYMVIDEKSTGPFSLAEVILNPMLTPETLIWKPGLADWVTAGSLSELAPVFATKKMRENTEVPPEYVSPNQESNPFAGNPQYQPHHTYNNQREHYHHPNYGGYGYRPNIRTNWMPWAIAATIVGFFFSCIGAIFGIIGIVQANRANTLFARGLDREGEAANSNAKIMTIIGFVFAAVGLIVGVSFSSVYGSLNNLSYI